MEAESSDLSAIFGGGKSAASEDEAPTGALVLGLEEDDEPEAPPPDFAVHAAEAFPELAGDDGRIDALYRAIKACHPAV